MAPPRPPRLLPALRALLYWSLVYGYCGLCASVHLLKLLWSIGRAPAQTFRRAARPSPPACLSDPSLGTHCYVRIKDSGLRFHYVAAGERGRPLMLLLHGFPEFWYSWRHQLREFKSEYRVVALDLRGYGESDAPAHLESYKLDCLIADTKDIVDSLGYSKCVLIGHDWGGMIAWLIAICYPEMIMKLIVINFPHPSVFTGPEAPVHQPEHGHWEKRAAADLRRPRRLRLCLFSAWSAKWSDQPLSKHFQLPASQTAHGDHADAAPVGRGRCVYGG